MHLRCIFPMDKRRLFLFCLLLGLLLFWGSGCHAAGDSLPADRTEASGSFPVRPEETLAASAAISDAITSTFASPSAPLKETPIPIQPLTGITIGIDPGHQGKGNQEPESIFPGSKETKKKVSSGTQGKWTRVPEYQVVLQVGMRLRLLLEAKGAVVIMSRETHDIDISNAQRAVLMNQNQVDLVIRIHCNGNENTDIYGACMLVPSGSMNPEIHKKSLEAGGILLKSFVQATGAKDNGVIKRSDLTGFNWSQVPVCLIEMGYMSNKAEDLLLASETYQNSCAEGLFQGILQYFS